MCSTANSSRLRHKAYTHGFVRLWWFVERVWRHSGFIQPIRTKCAVYMNAVLHHMMGCAVLYCCKFIVDIFCTVTVIATLHTLHTTRCTSSIHTAHRQRHTIHAYSEKRSRDVRAATKQIISINTKLTLMRCVDQFKWNCWWARIANVARLFR